MTSPLADQSPNPPFAEAEHAPPRARESSLTRYSRNLAVQDWFIGVYFVIFFLALTFGSGPGRAECIKRLAVDYAIFIGGMLLVRGEIIRPRTIYSSLTYRCALFFSVFLSYFQLREILPAVSSRTVDADIFAFDLRVFHVEPSLAWDKFVTPATTEWFAFFYFGYFFLLAVHVLPFMLAARDRYMTADFSLGIFIVFCVAHIVYMIVPGYGPYQFLATRFEHPLSGGLFWGLVRATVDASGAQKDIFPSLHTAAPTFFAFFSWRYRDRLPFRFTWPLVALFASQTICATMFLRWHYLVDIFAGITLAAIAAFGGGRIVAWERSRRARLGIDPIFTPLNYRELGFTGSTHDDANGPC